MNRGALIVVVTRQGLDVEPDVWADGLEKLNTAYNQFVVPAEPPMLLTDLKIVVLHLAHGGDDGVDFFGNGLFDDLTPDFAPVPEFVDVVRVGGSGDVHPFQPTLPRTSGSVISQLPAERGWVPTAFEYKRLIDDATFNPRTEASYVGEFGHAPAKLYLSAGVDVTHPYDPGIQFRRVSGLTALGISNRTDKRIAVETGSPPVIAFHPDHHLYRDWNLSDTVQRLRMSHGVSTEFNEWGQAGFEVVEGNPNTAEIVFDTVFHELARKLNRVRRHLDSGVVKA